jgi:8-oxo-dGTP diphosphatase
MIRVVSGLAERDGCVLMGLRKPGKLRPNLWELPGGKIESNETAHDAIVREWREELDVTVTQVGGLIASCMLEVEIPICVELYPIAIIGEPKLLDHTELIWTAPLSAVRSLPCSPGFYLHYPWIARWMREYSILFAMGAAT